MLSGLRCGVGRAVWKTRSPLWLVGALVLAAGACSGGQAQVDESAKTASEISAVSGLYDVGGGVELYLSCEGTGGPTIVYFHGAIDEAAFSGASSAADLQETLSTDHRFCRYDRRNVGMSDDVSGYFTGTTAAEDLDGLLAAAGIDPPYVLLGASFGGLIAHIYAATYPEDVVGMVSLDGSIPKDITLDAVVPEDMRYKPDEDRNSNEKLSHYAALNEALALTPPDVPFRYLLATPSEWPTTGVPAYDDVILDLVAEYAASYPQGMLVEVEAPHDMEPAVPEIIVDHLRQVIDEAGY